MDAVEYSFNIKLYQAITYHELKVNPSCIQIGLHKREHGLWAQLLKRRSKPPVYITFDAEHSVLSSSEDEESDSESPLLLLTSESR